MRALAYRIDSPTARFVRLWTRLRLPRAQSLLRRAGVWNQPLWVNEPRRVCRGRWHGYRMALDASDFHQRGAYFYGHSLDPDVQLCVLSCLRPGDTCIDVGANIGLISMLAAHAVGPRGVVLSFEPNPDIYERLLWHISENALSQVWPQRLALSDRDAALTLTVPPTGNTGAASLGSLPARHGGRVGKVYDVPVRIGDEVVGPLPDAPMLIKLDVEGHETAALRGLRRTIAAHRPAILLESNVEMLPANGSGVEELFALLAEMGYEAFGPSVVWGRWSREWRLRLNRVPRTWRPGRTQNVLFLRADGVYRERLTHLIVEA